MTVEIKYLSKEEEEKQKKREEIIPEGDYEAVIDELRDYDTHYVSVLKFIFTITDADYKGIQVSGLTSTMYKESGNKTKSWLDKLGVSLKENTPIDYVASKVLGKKCIVKINHKKVKRLVPKLNTWSPYDYEEKIMTFHNVEDINIIK